VKEFKSKFPIGGMVEFKPKSPLPEDAPLGNCVGIITEVSFWKSDAVNYACSYKINKVNTAERSDYVNEHDVIKLYEAR